MTLNHRKTYLQIAFNQSLDEIKQMIDSLPTSDRILIEAGTPLIKTYGEQGIVYLKNYWQKKLGKPGYIVADLKCMDRGSREIASISRAGAQAATCLGLAPIETINEFISNCVKHNIDSMIDMMNVEFPFEILKKLKLIPDVVILHRGVDESNNREKQIPYHQIHLIKATYRVLISIAGGENIKEVKRAIFNDANIAVVWRLFNNNSKQTSQLAKEFLKTLKY
ncbi:MAG: orotidine 5'-phosphate decarboxylase [Patescibacteria group bacterium]|nr:orotidine 5'-phosphate decarboxylase [Patescibacteria group bacterium]